MDNKILKTSLSIGRILEITIYAMIALVIVIFCSVFLFGASIDWVLFNPNNLSFSIKTGEIGNHLLLDQIPSGVLVFMLGKATVTLVILSMMIRLVINVLKSLRSFDTFKSENVRTLRKMGNLFILWFLVAIPGVTYIDESLVISVSVLPSILLGTLICYLLSEIFKEGNRLMEDNKLTI